MIGQSGVKLFEIRKSMVREHALAKIQHHVIKSLKWVNPSIEYTVWYQFDQINQQPALYYH